MFFHIYLIVLLFMEKNLKIIYSSLIFSKYKELSYENIQKLKKKEKYDINIDNIEIFENCLKDIISPIVDLYNYDLIFDNNINYIKLNINFDNVKDIVKKGGILPNRAKFFEILIHYKKMIIKNFFSSLDNLILKNIRDINDKFKNLKNQENQKIIDKDSFSFNEIYFNLEDKSISFEEKYLNHIKDFSNGGIIIEENEYGKYLDSEDLPLNSIINENDTKINNLYYKDFINKFINKTTNLICVSNSRLDYWKNRFSQKKVLVINSFTIFKKLCYKKIFDYEVVIVTINFLNSSNYKSKLDDYKIFNEINERSFINSRNDLLRNKDIIWNNEPLIHLYFWNNIVIDFVYDDLKKNTNDNLIYSLCGLKKWVIFNNFKENIQQSDNIFKLFNRRICADNFKNFITNNKIFIPKLDIKVEKILLEFNENESKGYWNYVDSLKDIYSKNDMKFEEDSYLQKYCSYPQRHLKINNIVKNLEENDKSLKMNVNYKRLLQEKIKKSEKIICEICLSDIDDDNLGMTECGHLYCFSCIYKNIKYSERCPNCRHKISLDKIFYLTDNSNQIVINSDILDELGTKNSKLLLLLNKIDKVLILSNFDECLHKLNKLFIELNINSVLTKNNDTNKDYSGKTVYLSNYDEAFFKIKNKYNVDEVICLEPYYALKKKLKFYDILKSTNSKKIKFILIKNTIEESIFNNHLINNLLLIQ
jgi:hypothetical protein